MFLLILTHRGRNEMQVEYYEPTRRDKLRAAAVSDTPAGEASRKWVENAIREVNEWRRKHGLPLFPLPTKNDDKNPEVI